MSGAALISLSEDLSERLHFCLYVQFSSVSQIHFLFLCSGRPETCETSADVRAPLIVTLVSVISYFHVFIHSVSFVSNKCLIKKNSDCFPVSSLLLTTFINMFWLWGHQPMKQFCPSPHATVPVMFAEGGFEKGTDRSPNHHRAWLFRLHGPSIFGLEHTAAIYSFVNVVSHPRSYSISPIDECQLVSCCLVDFSAFTLQTLKFHLFIFCTVEGEIWKFLPKCLCASLILNISMIFSPFLEKAEILSPSFFFKDSTFHGHYFCIKSSLNSLNSVTSPVLNCVITFLFHFLSASKLPSCQLVFECVVGLKFKKIYVYYQYHSVSK